MATRKRHNGSQKPGPLEEEMIGIFVQFAQMLSLPRSLGEIYGMLFLSPEPITLDDIVMGLGISKGSASQGLRQLKALGAIVPHYRTGDRREHFTAEMELRKIARGFLKEHVQPQMQSMELRMESVDTQLAKTKSSASQTFLRDRLDRLQGWHRNSRDLMPLIAGFLKT